MPFSGNDPRNCFTQSAIMRLKISRGIREISHGRLMWYEYYILFIVGHVWLHRSRNYRCPLCPVIKFNRTHLLTDLSTGTRDAQTRQQIVFKRVQECATNDDQVKGIKTEEKTFMNVKYSYQFVSRFPLRKLFLTSENEFFRLPEDTRVKIPN